MEFLKIKKQIHETGFDEFHQAGSPNKFGKMNVVAESKRLNKQFWICVEGGYTIKDTFYIAFRPLDNTKAKTERIYCKNQTEVVNELKKIAEQIKEKRRNRNLIIKQEENIMNIKIWNSEAEIGYKQFTTFFMDFSIADSFGIEAIKDTYKRAFKHWKNDYKYLTELVLVLNRKCWQFAKENETYLKLYSDLYYKTNDYAFDNLQGEELQYYIRTID